MVGFIVLFTVNEINDMKGPNMVTMGWAPGTQHNLADSSG